MLFFTDGDITTTLQAKEIKVKKYFGDNLTLSI
jgi:hypothetical protein